MDDVDLIKIKKFRKSNIKIYYCPGYLFNRRGIY